MADATPTKTCTKCGKTLPLTEFYRHKATRDGFDTRCKECNKAASRVWRQANPEKVRDIGRRHYLANRQAYIERAQQSKGIKNPLTRRRFPLAPPGWKFCLDCRYLLPFGEFYTDRASIDGYTYRCKNCSNALRYNLMTRAARARVRAGDGLPFTACDMLRIYRAQCGRCAYCRVELRKRFALDHVVPVSKGGGNEPGNVVVACLQCNYLKADLDVDEFRTRHLRAS